MDCEVSALAQRDCTILPRSSHTYYDIEGNKHDRDKANGDEAEAMKDWRSFLHEFADSTEEHYERGVLALERRALLEGEIQTHCKGKQT